MNYKTFFFLQIKRVLKNKAFLALLLLFPVAMLLFSGAFRSEEDSRIRIGLCLTTEEEFTENIYQKLLDTEDSLFTFLPVSSEEELTKLVQSNRIECGYLFKKPLLRELDRSHSNNLITVFVSETTTCKGVVNELVYANIFEEYSLHLLQEVLHEEAHLPFSAQDVTEEGMPPVTDKDIEEHFRAQLSEGGTFTFEVNFLSTDAKTETNSVASTVTPLLRGLASLFLLLCGFLALLTVHDDQTGGLYRRLHGVARPLCAAVTMLSYLLPSGLVTLLSLGITGAFTGLIPELCALLCYVLLLLVFYALLGLLLRNRTTLCAAFPMVLLCTLLFTPVIADLSAFLPWLKAIRYAFPTYYYLLFF